MMRSLTYSRKNPYLLMVWLGILGSCLVFFFLLTVYFTRLGNTDWVEFSLPQAFVYSTLCILFSSVSLHLSTQSMSRELYGEGFRWLAITMSMAMAFCILQVVGWLHLQQNGIHFFQISGAFLYLLSGLHMAHIVIGITGLGWVMVDCYFNRRYVDGFIQSLNPMKTTRLQVVTIFWHFLGGLWVSLFVLLWLTN